MDFFNDQQMAKFLFALAGFIFLLGLFFYFKDSIGFLGKLGNLPGDIFIEKSNWKIYLPITTSIIVSIVLSLLLYLLRK